MGASLHKQHTHFKTMPGQPPDLTVLFSRLSGGDRDALNEIMSALYSELRALAFRRMRAEGRQLTLQPTALLNEAYLRLMHGPERINDRQHFFALAAQAMRRILVDHARQRRAEKRGGDRERVTLELVPGQESVDVDLLALDEALTALSQLDARSAQVVELRFFGGLTDKEVCELLEVSLPAARRDWVFARSFLKTRLASASPA
jgi:RNA polymerase sigma-70 factor (ECF subfamily)